MIRIILVEDHTLVRAGVRALLEKNPDMEILGEGTTGQEAVDLSIQVKPDLVVMDIMMPRLNGIQAVAQMRELKLPVKVILLSMYADEGLIQQALQLGVKGYVLKSAISDELTWAIRAVARNETYLSSQVSSILVQRSLNPHALKPNNDPLGMLSPREKEVLQLIAEEHTSSEIAEILFISEKTVEKHRANLMEKLNVRNLAGLVRLAVKHGLVDKEAYDEETH